MLWWRSFSQWGWEHVAFSFAYKGDQYLLYECLQPIATQIAQDARPKIIDAQLTLIVGMGQGAYLSCFWLWREPIHPKKIMTNQRQYLAISNRISECDYK